MLDSIRYCDDHNNMMWMLQGMLVGQSWRSSHEEAVLPTPPAVLEQYMAGSHRACGPCQVRSFCQTPLVGRRHLCQLLSSHCQVSSPVAARMPGIGPVLLPPCSVHSCCAPQTCRQRSSSPQRIQQGSAALPAVQQHSRLPRRRHHSTSLALCMAMLCLQHLSTAMRITWLVSTRSARCSALWMHLVVANSVSHWAVN